MRETGRGKHGGQGWGGVGRDGNGKEEGRKEEKKKEGGIPHPWIYPASHKDLQVHIVTLKLLPLKV